MLNGIGSNQALMIFVVETSPSTKLHAMDSLARNFKKKVANRAFFSATNDNYQVEVIIDDHNGGKTGKVMSPEGKILFPGDVRKILESLTGCPVLWLEGDANAGVYENNLKSNILEKFPTARIKEDKNMILVEIDTDCQENSLAAVREKLGEIGIFTWMN
jgi:hypothetical protein